MVLRRRVGLLVGLWFVAVCVAGGIAFASEVELKRSSWAGSSVSSGELPLTVGDVAVVSIDDAVLRDAVSGAVLLEDARSAARGRAYVTVSVADVRLALDAAGVRTGAIAMSGGRCVVRLSGAVEQGPTVEEDPGPRWEVASVVLERASGTVLGEITRLLVDAVRLDDEVLEGEEAIDAGRADDAAERDELALDVRLRVVNGGEDVLDRALSSGRISVTRRTELSGRVVFEVQVFEEGGELGSRERVLIEAERRVEAWRATRRVSRGRVLSAADVERVGVWEPLGNRGGAAVVEDAVGREASAVIGSGEVVREGVVASPMLVERRSWARLLAHAGGLVVETRVLVLEDGRLGDEVLCRMERGRETFVAVVTGPGRVTMTVD